MLLGAFLDVSRAVELLWLIDYVQLFLYLSLSAIYWLRNKDSWLLKQIMYTFMLWSGSRQCNALWSLLTCARNCSTSSGYLRCFISPFCSTQPFSGFWISLLLSADKSSFLWVTLWDVKQVSILTHVSGQRLKHSVHWFFIDPIEFIMPYLDAASLHRTVWIE